MKATEASRTTNRMRDIDEEEVSVDAGSSMLNDAAGVLSGLSAADQEDLVRLIGEFADMEPDPERQETMRQLPETLGLVD